jgi:hypothetical protein
MASIVFNGETVHLRETSLRDFQRFAEIAFQRLRLDATIRQSVGSVLVDALRQGQKADDNVVQTIFWALHDLGVGKVDVDLEAKTINLTEVKETDASRGAEGAMAVAACETGRAYVAALANVQQRSILINTQQVRVFPQSKETLGKVSQAIHANRLVNEDLVFTACRAVGAMIKQGKTSADLEFLGAIEIMACFGVADILIDLDGQKLGIRSFNEANAMAAALLQGANAKQVQQVRERVHQWKTRLAAAAAGEGAKPGSSPSQPKSAGQRLLVPPVIGNRRGVRRKS